MITNKQKLADEDDSLSIKKLVFTEKDAKFKTI